MAENETLFTGEEGAVTRERKTKADRGTVAGCDVWLDSGAEQMPQQIVGSISFETRCLLLMFMEAERLSGRTETQDGLVEKALREYVEKRRPKLCERIGAVVEAMREE